MLVKEERSRLACRWLLTCASVRSFTFISSNTDFGVAPRRCSKKKKKKQIKGSFRTKNMHMHAWRQKNQTE
jgi:hypothetical protein